MQGETLCVKVYPERETMKETWKRKGKSRRKESRLLKDRRSIC
jgi:hypothetical protein